MSGSLIYLTSAAVRRVHDRVLRAHGGSPGIRDEGLLESAVVAPQATMAGFLLMSDPVEVGAAYLFYLGQNHPFVDGNKRTALASALIILSNNGLLETRGLQTDAWEALVLAVASSQFNREQTTARLRELLTELG